MGISKNEVRLRNTRKGPFITSKALPRDDDNIIAQQEMVKPGNLGTFKRDNTSVMIAARAGDLVPRPDDQEAQDWVASLEAPPKRFL